MIRSVMLCVGLLVLGAAPAFAADRPADVTQERLRAADSEPGKWMAPGRTWDEQRFSPLTQINDKNVGRLGLAWYADLNTYRGVEATPLVIDGVLYNVSAWDITTAYDAATGKVLWTYDPQGAGRVGARSPAAARSAGGSRPGRARSSLRARRPADRARRQDRQAGVEHADTTDRASRCRSPARRASPTGSRGDRQRRRRLRCARVHVGLRRRHRQARLEVLHRAGRSGENAGRVRPPTRPCPWPRRPGTASGGSTAAAATTGTASSTIRSCTWCISAPATARPTRSEFRSPGGGDNLFLCSVVAVDARTGHYALALPGDPGGGVGLRLHHPLMILADLKIGGRTRQVMHARAQERLLLRAGPQDRQAASRPRPTSRTPGPRAST